jgi:hypothetical protein
VYKDLFVWVPVQNAGWFKKRSQKMRCILKGGKLKLFVQFNISAFSVSGVAEPGQILAIMVSC